MIDLSNIPGAFTEDPYLPRPVWDNIADAIHERFSIDQLDEAWTEAARQWLGRLRDALPDGYGIHESQNFLLLSTFKPRQTKGILTKSEYALECILKFLPDVTRDEGDGKHVVLAFAEFEQYYDYLSYFGPDGESGSSGGCMIREDPASKDFWYGHIVLSKAENSYYWPVIYHELAHACLSHLFLPLWLEEGVVQLLEDSIAGGGSFMVNQEWIDEHLEFWSKNDIGLFWRGEGFFLPNDGQKLSYHLAHWIARNLVLENRKQFVKFLLSADDRDWGEQAIRQTFDRSLDELIPQLIVPDNWY